MNNDKKEIKNEKSYFCKVIKNMETKEKIKESKINNHEISLNEFYDDMPSDFEIEKQLEETSFLGWIELLENEKLYEAVKSLSTEDQIFLSYIIKEQRTQRELARLYKVDQRTVGRRYDKISQKIRKICAKRRT